jgi:hypothetical protein
MQNLDAHGAVRGGTVRNTGVEATVIGDEWERQKGKLK